MDKISKKERAMKFKLILACTLIATLVAVSACSSVLGAMAPNEVQVDNSYTGKEVEIAQDGILTITLESNPTTGFAWEVKDIANKDIVEFMSNEFQSSENGLIGGGGAEVWTFKALAQGKTTITMEYSRPWEGGEKAERTFFLTVVHK
jgi:inhibitor of cysteine peptidase